MGKGRGIDNTRRKFNDFITQRIDYINETFFPLTKTVCTSLYQDSKGILIWVKKTEGINDYYWKWINSKRKNKTRAKIKPQTPESLKI